MKKPKELYWLDQPGKIITLLSIFIVALGCTTTREGFVEYTDNGYYRNNVNSQKVRDQIEDSFESVVRIQNNVIYRTYQFYVDELPRESEVHGRDLERISVESYIDDQSTAGTAIVVSEFRGHFALLTASHTVFYPDTIWHYADHSPNEEDLDVEAVSVKQTVNHFALVERGIIKLKLAVYDTNRDLAVMTNTNSEIGNLLKPLPLPIGNPKQLDWGDMVYALGYPKGAKMVTLGTVSLSDHPRRSILIDASFNRGFSGGGIFGVRNDGSGLEWLGVVTSALGENETYLAPDQVGTEDFNPDIPYTGPIFVRSVPRIDYGITNAVDVNEIQEFFRENERRLNDSGMVIP